MSNSSGSAMPSNHGIFIEGDLNRQFLKGNDFPIKFEARFPVTDDIEDPVNWIRSLFLTCISRKNSAVESVHLLRSTVILPGDFKTVSLGSERIVQYVHEFNCAEKLRRGTIKDSYYIHLSARRFVSDIIRIDVV